MLRLLAKWLGVVVVTVKYLVVDRRNGYVGGIALTFAEARIVHGFLNYGIEIRSGFNVSPNSKIQKHS